MRMFELMLEMSRVHVASEQQTTEQHDQAMLPFLLRDGLRGVGGDIIIIDDDELGEVLYYDQGNGIRIGDHIAEMSRGSSASEQQTTRSAMRYTIRDKPCNSSDDACIICTENVSCVEMNTCKHKHTCYTCTEKMFEVEESDAIKCPVCRAENDSFCISF